MFSANENLMLRQHKRRIVEQVESTMPEEALDFGTTVMVMQVSCKAPGCVPLETAIIIVFPNSTTELIPGLPESQNGGSYKTKVLKPMADVTKEDLLEALPPQFEGGKRTMEKLCRNARDVMLAQITQLFGEEDDNTVSDRMAVAEYLQECLKDYVARKCKPPELGELFPPLNGEEEKDRGDLTGATVSKESPPKDAPNSLADPPSTTPTVISNGGSIPAKGNITIRRVVEEPSHSAQASGTGSNSTSTMSGPPRHQRALQQALNPMGSNNILRLFEREHAPGIRQAGCPCCDPDNVSNIVDNMMML